MLENCKISDIYAYLLLTFEIPYQEGLHDVYTEGASTVWNFYKAEDPYLDKKQQRITFRLHVIVSVVKSEMTTSGVIGHRLYILCRDNYHIRDQDDM